MKHHLQPIDQNKQSFWQLAGIQIAGSSLLGLVSGAFLQGTYGLATAMLSALVANLIMWPIGLGVLAATYGEKKNVLELISHCFGSWLAKLMASLLILTFILFVAGALRTGLDTTMPVLETKSLQGWASCIWIVIGLGTSLLMLGGIVWVRRVCLVTLPVLVAMVLFLSSFASWPFLGEWGVSLVGVLTALSITLPKMICSPSFFQHGKSWLDVQAGLLAWVAGTFLWQLAGMFLAGPLTSSLGTGGSTPVSEGVLLLLMGVSVLCANMVSAYFTLGSQKFLFGNRSGNTGLMTISLLSILFFVFLGSSWLALGRDLLVGYLSCLTLVFFLFLFKKRAWDHVATRTDMAVSGTCWLIGCVVITIVRLELFGPVPHNALAFGIGMTAIAMMIATLIEVTWRNCRALARERSLRG